VLAVIITKKNIKMRTHIHIYIFFLILSLGELTAQTFEVDGINYNVLNATDVEVISKTGCYDGNVVIPSTVNYMLDTYNVTIIGYEAFKNCDITNITLPNSITKIDDYAFRDCRDITAINLPDSVTSIGFGAFLYCTLMESVNIPDGITKIDRFTFGSCNALTSISIPESVTSIGTYAFTNCSNLTTVNTNVESPIDISEHMFWNLDLSLIALNVPAGSENAYSAASVWQDFGTINGTLSVNKVEQYNLKIYPNPSTDYISISGLKQTENYKIYNLLGQKMAEGKLSIKKPIDIRNFNNGLYFIHFENRTALKLIKK
jgi:hypothetical protein